MTRRAGVLLAIVAVGVVGALARSGTLDPRPSFGLSLSSGEEFAALPVYLRDGTGLVMGMRRPLAPDFEAGQGRIENPEGEPASLGVSWSGGGCDDRVDLAFERDDDGYVMGLHVDTGFDLGCPAIGFARGVVVDLSMEVDAADVTLVLR